MRRLKGPRGRGHSIGHVMSTITWLSPRRFSLRFISPKESSHRVPRPNGTPKACTPITNYSTTYFSRALHASRAPVVHGDNNIGEMNKMDDVVTQKIWVATNRGNVSLQGNPDISFSLHCCFLMYAFYVATTRPSEFTTVVSVLWLGPAWGGRSGQGTTDPAVVRHIWGKIWAED